MTRFEQEGFNLSDQTSYEVSMSVRITNNQCRQNLHGGTSPTLSDPAAPIAERTARAHTSSLMTVDDPDAALVKLAQQGDARAFEALMVKYQRRIARHVTRFIKRSGDVEDVVQEIFIKAFRGIASFKGESAFYTWLYRISTNTAFSFMTRQSKLVVLQQECDASESESSPDLDGSDDENPERILLAKQIAVAIEQAMKRLQPELAEALLLFEVEGKQYKQIAEMLQVPVGTVRTRIFRAREFIAQRLEPLLDPVRDRRW
jgi:RNA polymerase sigma-70 factor, ECF subfamily